MYDDSLPYVTERRSVQNFTDSGFHVGQAEEDVASIAHPFLNTKTIRNTEQPRTLFRGKYNRQHPAPDTKHHPTVRYLY